jgi:AAA domain
MSFTIRPAVREAVGLLIGVAGASGSGKTFSAMRVAKGIVGPGKRFCVIDTEARRALHYAAMFEFDHLELPPPFTPERYSEAIKAADQAGYQAIVVDSMSHSWAGDGGVLDMQEEEFQRMGGRDAAKMASWIKPKLAFKRMVQNLLQVRAHLILCFRAEPKIEMVKEDGKLIVREKHSLIGKGGWIPVTEKNLPFELTVSFLLTPDEPGMPKPIKLQEQHKAMFPLDHPLDERSGELIAAWAKGDASAPPPAKKPAPASDAEQRLRAAGSLRALELVWLSLTAGERKELTSLKDQCKEAIIAAETQTEE